MRVCFNRKQCDLMSVHTAFRIRKQSDCCRSGHCLWMTQLYTQWNLGKMVPDASYPSRQRFAKCFLIKSTIPSIQTQAPSFWQRQKSKNQQVKIATAQRTGPTGCNNGVSCSMTRMLLLTHLWELAPVNETIWEETPSSENKEFNTWSF